MLTWADVAKVHRTWKGVYSREGLVISLLCNPHSHGDQGDDVWENSVAYRVSFKSHTGDANALKRTMAAQRAVHMFEKLGKNQWVDRGLWTIRSFVEEADGLCFSLTRSESDVGKPMPTILADR
jgi:hypothetical protein